MAQQFSYKSPFLSSRSSQTCDDLYSSLKTDRATPTSFLWAPRWRQPHHLILCCGPPRGPGCGRKGCSQRPRTCDGQPWRVDWSQTGSEGTRTFQAENWMKTAKGTSSSSGLQRNSPDWNSAYKPMRTARKAAATPPLHKACEEFFHPSFHLIPTTKEL